MECSTKSIRFPRRRRQAGPAAPPWSIAAANDPITPFFKFSTFSGISKHSRMEHLSIERLRSPRSPRRCFFYPESENNSGSSTPFVSAPSSPHYYYYSTPPSPPRSRSRAAAEDEEEKVAVPFSWEEKPGTPKRNAAAANSGGFSFLRTDDSTQQVAADAPIKTSVEHLSAIGFHFSAPVSPKRSSPRGELKNSSHLLDEFEFSSARMSDADSITSASMSHADELFFQGQLLPLKLPPRLQAPPSLQLEASLFYTPRAAAFAHQFSPRSPKSPKSPKRKDPPARPAAAAEGHHHRRARSLSPLKFFNDDKNSSSSENKHPARPVRRSLRELLHLNTAQQSTTKRGSSNKSDSRSSSKSSTSSQTFLGSRSSSVSSTNSQSRSSSISSRQVNPVASPRGEQQHLHYSSRAKKVNDEELRRRTFLPYKPGLLGCLSCITIGGVRGIREQHLPTPAR